jgi:hypothetical protein
VVLAGIPVFDGVNGGKLEGRTIAGIEAFDGGQSAYGLHEFVLARFEFFEVRSFDFERAELAAGNGDDRVELNGPGAGISAARRNLHERAGDDEMFGFTLKGRVNRQQEKSKNQGPGRICRTPEEQIREC